MGYRSTFITTDTPIKLPEWFVEKYQSSCNFGVTYNEDDSIHPSFPMSSRAEGKMYGMYAEVKQDIQRVLAALPDSEWHPTIGLAILHEDCAYEIVTISRDGQSILGKGNN